MMLSWIVTMIVTAVLEGLGGGGPGEWVGEG